MENIEKLCSEVRAYIDKFYIDHYFFSAKSIRAEEKEGLLSDCDLDCLYERCERRSESLASSSMSAMSYGIFEQRLDDMLRNMDRSFSETLLHYIDKKEISDVEAYKRSNVDKKTFSKIRCNDGYRPSKATAVSFAIGLRLSYEETQHLLSTAGMCLSRSNKFDVIIEYFIITGNYDSIFDVNEVLYKFDLPLLGV